MPVGPQSRRCIAALPPRPAVDGQAGSRVRRRIHRIGETVGLWSDQVARGGVEPPTFRFSGGRSYQLSYLADVRTAGGARAVLTGLEPATSALTGRRALQLLHRTWSGTHADCRSCPQRDSNPCYRLERAASWAARRWGRRCHHRTFREGSEAPIRPRRRPGKHTRYPVVQPTNLWPDHCLDGTCGTAGTVWETETPEACDPADTRRAVISTRGPGRGSGNTPETPAGVY